MPDALAPPPEFPSGGQRHMSSIAGSWPTDSQRPLFDEPHEGLAPIVARDRVKAINRLRA